MNTLKEFLVNIIADTVINKKEVRVDFIVGGLDMSFYQDKIGTPQYFTYYMSNTKRVESNTTIILSVKNKKDDSDCGRIVIKLNELNVISVESDCISSKYTTIRLNDQMRIYIKN